VRVVQAGGVELDELHVRNRGARPMCHRETVTCRYVRIGRVQVDLAGTARREHDRASQIDVYFARARVEHVRAENAIRARFAQFRGGDEIDRDLLVDNADLRAIGC
jgi:hypothetical protein